MNGIAVGNHTHGKKKKQNKNIKERHQTEGPMLSESPGEGRIN